MSMILNPYAFSGAPTPPPPLGDPYWANVVLLLNGNGVDGSTTFSDLSDSGHSVTATGSVEVDTAEKKFGTGSILFSSGLSDSLEIADSTDFDFGSGDFTLEAWLNVNNTASRTVFAKWSSFQQSFFLGGGASNYGFYYSTAGTDPNLAITLNPWPSTGTWFHLAVCRDGSNLRMFVDGTQEGSTFNIGSTSFFDGSGPLIIGDNSTINPAFDGWMDEIRITKGVARYTSNFTAPTSAFPTS